jgi:hypothetical protein
MKLENYLQGGIGSSLEANGASTHRKSPMEGVATARSRERRERRKKEEKERGEEKERARVVKPCPPITPTAMMQLVDTWRATARLPVVP